MAKGDVSHIDLTVTDAERSVAFYDRVLSFLGFLGGPNTSGQGREVGGWMNLKTGFNIALHLAKPEHAGHAHIRYAPGLHHLAFDADSREDVDALHEMLLDMDATILDPPGEYYEGGYYAVFFADPDGLKLELVHLPKQST
jgi:glyoxylase I family protein